jgi:hypothetical protein
MQISATKKNSPLPTFPSKTRSNIVFHAAFQLSASFQRRGDMATILTTYCCKMQQGFLSKVASNDC